MAPYDVRRLLRPAPILIVVPPFARLDRPALGVHLLQGIARRHGVELQVLYANLLFAAFINPQVAETLAIASYDLFMGERLFARAAFATPPMGYDNGEAIDRVFADQQHALGPRFGITANALLDLEARVDEYLDSFVPALAAGGYDVIGCSSSFEQTAASVAILRGIKRRSPRTLAILGGANCEGEMAGGLAALVPELDVIFAGESEATFGAFVAARARGEPPPARIVSGTPCTELDALPTPDYADYYAQLRALLPASWLSRARINYETSRGCWWGQKHHCTFCGLNGRGMAMREKSPDRVLAELHQLLAPHPNRQVVMTDNIMPHSYWQTVVPRLAGELPGLDIMYEQKANMSLADVTALARAGITTIQPGIEALSTPLLRHMDKGTTCAQNLALLRYARACGIDVIWSLLSGFPGDRLAWYEELLELLPLVRHLPPPGGRHDVVIDRFSPYHEHPERYGIRELTPAPVYHQWLPAGAPVHAIAYHFDGVFDSESRADPGVMAAIDRELDVWRAGWSRDPSALEVRASGDGYELVDTRGLARVPERERIDEAQAVAALVGRSLSAAERPGDAWARTRRLVVERDRRLVPLAVAEPRLLARFEERHRRGELTVLRPAS